MPSPAEPVTTHGGRAARIGFAFDAKNKLAWRLAKAAAGKLVKDITEETMAAIRAVIQKVIRDGIPPADAARAILGVISTPGASVNEIPGMVGLNTVQAQAAMNYRVWLVNMGHTPNQIDKLMTKYVARKLRERAVTIARTETMWALNTGAEAAYEQAVKKGFLPPDGRLKWIVTHDDRLCPICAPMDGVTKAIGDEHFEGASGPPAHPRCRCTIVYTED